MKKKTLNFVRKDIYLLVIILFVASLLRLIKFSTPLADFHSWRQADTAAVARNFTRTGFDLLHPTYDDLSSIESGKENPKGFRMVEFPLYNATFALMYKVAPILPIEQYGRLTSIISSLIVIGILYYLLLKESGRIAALCGALIYSIFPFFIFFSRVVLPETTGLALAFLSIFFLYRGLDKETSREKVIFGILSVVFFALSILVKPTTVFFGVALFYLFIRKYRLQVFSQYTFYLYFLVAAVPTFLWRKYIQGFPEGIPANDWLITSVNTYQGLQNIFFRPAFFRWIFFERINAIILGGYMSVFFLLGIVKRTGKYLIHAILISSLLYLFVFQGGNVQHEYYQTLILPALAAFVGIGIQETLNYAGNEFNRWIAYFIILLTLVFSLFFSYYHVRDYYNYSTDLVQEADIIQALTKPTDWVVTDTTGDTTLLYLADRKGAPALYKDEITLKQLGYSYLVIFNKDYSNQLKEKGLTTVFENDKLTLFRL